MNDESTIIHQVIPDRTGSVVYQFYRDDWGRAPVIAWHFSFRLSVDDDYELDIEPEPITIGSLSEVYCIEVRLDGRPVYWEFPYDRSFPDADSAIEYGKQQAKESWERQERARPKPKASR